MTDPRTDGGPRRVEQSVCGVVLAGGRSTRFGDADKALATVDGDPMLARVVDAAAAVAGSVVVNCRVDQRAAFADVLESVDADLRFAVDDRPDEGPLVGLDRALRGVDAPVVLVLACDLPWLESGLLAALVDRLGDRDGDRGGRAGSAGRSRRRDAVVPVDADGYRKPTCAAYRTEVLRGAVAAALDADDRRLRAALTGLLVEEVDVDALGFPRRVVADVDTREDVGDRGDGADED